MTYMASHRRFTRASPAMRCLADSHWHPHAALRWGALPAAGALAAYRSPL